jgi:hypothetical protein
MTSLKNTPHPLPSCFLLLSSRKGDQDVKGIKNIKILLKHNFPGSITPSACEQVISISPLHDQEHSSDSQFRINLLIN